VEPWGVYGALTGQFEKRTALTGSRVTCFDGGAALVPVGVAYEETFVKFAERGFGGWPA
jgi:hypothetical protein